VDESKATPTYLSATEASSFLNIPVNTLGFWRYAGRGPKFFKLEGRVMYALEDLQTYVAAARAVGGPDAAA
jgi:hypothetical protein